MILIKTKAKIKKGMLKAKVKYPLVGGAELEIGLVSKLKAIVKIPFIYSAKLIGILQSKTRPSAPIEKEEINNSILEALESTEKQMKKSKNEKRRKK